MELIPHAAMPVSHFEGRMRKDYKVKLHRWAMIVLRRDGIMLAGHRDHPVDRCNDESEARKSTLSSEEKRKRNREQMRARCWHDIPKDM